MMHEMLKHKRAGLYCWRNGTFERFHEFSFKFVLVLFARIRSTPVAALPLAGRSAYDLATNPEFPLL